jgi:hypothetical protein
MVRTLADIVGGDATVPITTDRSKISRGWVQFNSTGGTCRIGDSLVAVGRGLPAPDGGGAFFPALDPAWDAYVLADIFAYIPVGVTLTVTYLE